LLKKMKKLFRGFFIMVEMILLVGASASGKTEIAKRLASAFSITKAITHTTRPMRKGERQDVDYHFVTVDDFLALKEKGGFVETTFYNGNYYGCSKAETGDDKCIILDPAGISSFLSLHNPNIVTFFLRTSDATREYRMRLRGDEEESIRKRLANDKDTFDEKRLPHVDYVIDADEEDVPTLTEKIYSLYQKRLGR